MESESVVLTFSAGVRVLAVFVHPSTRALGPATAVLISLCWIYVSCLHFLLVSLEAATCQAGSCKAG